MCVSVQTNFSHCKSLYPCIVRCHPKSYITLLQSVTWSNTNLKPQDFADALSIAVQSNRAVRFIRWYVHCIISIVLLLFMTFGCWYFDDVKYDTRISFCFCFIFFIIFPPSSLYLYHAHSPFLSLSLTHTHIPSLSFTSFLFLHSLSSSFLHLFTTFSPFLLIFSLFRGKELPSLEFKTLLKRNLIRFIATGR